MGAAPLYKKTGKCAVLRSLSVLVRIDEYLKFGPVRQPLLGVRGTLCIALTRACASLHINFETGASLRKLVGEIVILLRRLRQCIPLGRYGSPRDRKRGKDRHGDVSGPARGGTPKAEGP